MKITALMSLHQDNQYLTLVLEQIYDLVDQIVMLDGPYQWILDHYRDLPLDHSSHLSKIVFRGKPLLEHSKILHFYQVWKDEFEKRIFGYEQCRSELVLVIDSDEVIQINLPAIQRFWNSSHPIAPVEIFSLARTYARAEFPHYMLEHALADINRPHLCYRLFKRKLITGLDHVPYLQAIQPVKSVEIKPADLSLVSPDTIGRIYHLCVMRTGYDNRIKYLFYTALHYVSLARPDLILVKGGWSSYAEMLKDITLDDYLTLLIRGSLDPIRIPAGKVITHFDRLPDFIKEAVRYSDDVYAEMGADLKESIRVLDGFSLYFYVPEKYLTDLECTVVLRDVSAIDVSEFRLFYNCGSAPLQQKVCTADASSGTVSFTIPALSEEVSQELFARALAIRPILAKGKTLGTIDRLEIREPLEVGSIQERSR